MQHEYGGDRPTPFFLHFSNPPVFLRHTFLKRVHYFVTAEQGTRNEVFVILLIHGNCIVLRVKITPLSLLVNQSYRRSESSKMKILT